MRQGFLQGVFLGLLVVLAGCSAIALLASQDQKSDVKKEINKDKLEYPAWVIPEPEYLKDIEEDCTCDKPYNSQTF